MLGAGAVTVTVAGINTYRVIYNDINPHLPLYLDISAFPCGYVELSGTTEQIELYNVVPGNTSFSLAIDGKRTDSIAVGIDDDATAAIFKRP
jgi:hypothetical protein